MLLDFENYVLDVLDDITNDPKAPPIGTPDWSIEYARRLMAGISKLLPKRDETISRSPLEDGLIDGWNSCINTIEQLEEA